MANHSKTYQIYICTRINEYPVPGIYIYNILLCYIYNTLVLVGIRGVNQQSHTCDVIAACRRYSIYIIIIIHTYTTVYSRVVCVCKLHTRSAGRRAAVFVGREHLPFRKLLWIGHRHHDDARTGSLRFLSVVINVCIYNIIIVQVHLWSECMYTSIRSPCNNNNGNNNTWILLLLFYISYDRVSAPECVLRCLRYTYIIIISVLYASRMYKIYTDRSSRPKYI